MRENAYSEDELKIIILERKEKIIDNASCISYNNKYYIPINLATGDLSGLTAGTHEVEVKVTSDDVRIKLIPKTLTVKIVISKK